MLTSVIICPDTALSEGLVSALEGTGAIAVARVVEQYPNENELGRVLRAHAPEIVFLSFESASTAQAVIQAIEAEGRGVQVIAINRQCDAALLRLSMRLGVREFLTTPFTEQAVYEAIGNVELLIERKPVHHDATQQVFSFLPAKAGAGTSTLALNVSAALARQSDTRVLLSDFDLSSGIVRFLLKLKNEMSVLEAVERARSMDENLWQNLVTKVAGMDVLHAGKLKPNLRVQLEDIRGLVAFMRRNYDAVCFDMSGNLEQYSLELMQQSRRVIMVCTPEVPVLHLAREKLAILRSLDLDSRVMVVMNRTSKKSVFSKSQMEDMLERPVSRVFPNDYFGVNKTIEAGTCFPAGSEMGKLCDQFAAELLERTAHVHSDGKKKFLEFFNVMPQVLVRE